MSQSAPSQVPVWTFIAVGAAIVLGLALFKDRKTANTVAPHVSLPLLDGKKQEIMSGKVTVVDFWATWCAPCRASMPRVQHVFKDYTPKGVDLLSVDSDSDSPNRDPEVREFLLKNSLDFPVTLDDGSAQDAFHVTVLPTMMVVAKDGHIAWTHTGMMGAREETELRRVLDDALAER